MNTQLKFLGELSPLKHPKTCTHTLLLCSTVTFSFLYLFPAASLWVGLHLSVIPSVSPCLRFPRGCRQINVGEWLASSTSAESERWENMVNCEGETAPCSKEAVQPSISSYLQPLSAPRDGSQDTACINTNRDKRLR